MLEMQLSVLFVLFPIHQTAPFHVTKFYRTKLRVNPPCKAKSPLHVYQQQKAGGSGDLYLHTSPLGTHSQALGIVHKK